MGADWQFGGETLNTGLLKLNVESSFPKQMPEDQDYYQILRVSENATQQDIKQAFRRLARDCHPDLHPNDANAAKRFRALREAYEVLSDATRRKKYDRKRQKSSSEKKGGSAQVYYVRGVEKMLLQNYRAAVTDLSAAIRLNKRFVEAYLKRCEAYLALGEERAVLEDCQQILRYQPENAIAHYYRGRARQRLGYADSAIKAYNKAIYLQQDFPPPYYYRGVAHYELRYRNRAIADWREYADICKRQGNMQGYRLGIDTLNRYSWFPMKVGSRLFGWGKRSKSKPVQNFHRSPYRRQQVRKQLQNSLSQIATSIENTAKITVSTLTPIIRNPVGGILPAYSRLEPNQIPVVATNFLVFSNIAFLFGMLAHFGFNLNTLFRFLPVGIMPSLSVFGISFFTRFLLQSNSDWKKDLFLASSAILPLALFAFLSAFTTVIPGFHFLLIVVGVFPLSHTILLLYGGCSQLLNLSESFSALIVPIMVLITSLLSSVTLVVLS